MWGEHPALWPARPRHAWSCHLARNAQLPTCSWDTHCVYAAGSPRLHPGVAVSQPGGSITSCPPSLTAHGPPHGLSFNLTLQGPDMNWRHRQVGNHLQWMGEGQGLTAQLASPLPKLTPEHKLTLKSKFSGFSGHHRQQQHCQTPLAGGSFSPNRS